MNALDLDVTFVHPLSNWKLFLEFSNGEYRLLDFKKELPEKGMLFNQESLKQLS